MKRIEMLPQPEMTVEVKQGMVNHAFLFMIHQIKERFSHPDDAADVEESAKRILKAIEVICKDLEIAEEYRSNYNI